MIATVRNVSEQITYNNVMEVLVVNESYMNYNLFFNFITTHHNKDAKLKCVNASILS